MWIYDLFHAFQGGGKVAFGVFHRLSKDAEHEREGDENGRELHVEAGAELDETRTAIAWGYRYSELSWNMGTGCADESSATNLPTLSERKASAWCAHLLHMRSIVCVRRNGPREGEVLVSVAMHRAHDVETLNDQRAFVPFYIAQVQPDPLR